MFDILVQIHSADQLDDGARHTRDNTCLFDILVQIHSADQLDDGARHTRDNTCLFDILVQIHSADQLDDGARHTRDNTCLFDILVQIHSADQLTRTENPRHSQSNYNNNIIIIDEMAVFNVAAYPIEERRRWPVITASPRGQYYK